jgi:hypothetical protein
VASRFKCSFVLIALICIADLATVTSASAITLEVAKKCSTLANTAYPPTVVGNPAAGRQHGTAADLRSYFDKCVENDGKMPAPEQNSNKPDQASGGSGGANQPAATEKNENSAH